MSKSTAVVIDGKPVVQLLPAAGGCSRARVRFVFDVEVTADPYPATAGGEDAEAVAAAVKEARDEHRADFVRAALDAVLRHMEALDQDDEVEATTQYQG